MEGDGEVDTCVIRGFLLWKANSFDPARMLYDVDRKENVGLGGVGEY